MKNYLLTSRRMVEITPKVDSRPPCTHMGELNCTKHGIVCLHPNRDHCQYHKPSEHEAKADPAWRKLIESAPMDSKMTPVLVCKKHELMTVISLFANTPYYCQYCGKFLSPDEMKWIDWQELRKITDEEYMARVRRV